MTIEVGSKLPLTTSFQVLKDGKPTVRALALVFAAVHGSGRGGGIEMN
jgi:hypothetical protein